MGRSFLAVAALAVVPAIAARPGPAVLLARAGVVLA